MLPLEFTYSEMQCPEIHPHSAGSTSPTSREQFLNGEQEPWMFRGGIQSELQVRLIKLIRICALTSGKQFCFLVLLILGAIRRKGEIALKEKSNRVFTFVSMHSVQRLLPRERRRGLSLAYSSDAASDSGETEESPRTPVDGPPAPQPQHQPQSASSDSTVSENGDLGVGDKATRPLVKGTAATAVNGSSS